MTSDSETTHPAPVTDKSGITDLSELVEFTQNKISEAFHVSIDPAGGEDSTAIAAMRRMNDGRMKLVELQHYMQGEWEKQTPVMVYLLARAMLLKAKHRSDRIAKKMTKRTLRFGYVR